MEYLTAKKSKKWQISRNSSSNTSSHRCSKMLKWICFKDQSKPRIICQYSCSIANKWNKILANKNKALSFKTRKKLGLLLWDLHKLVLLPQQEVFLQSRVKIRINSLTEDLLWILKNWPTSQLLRIRVLRDQEIPYRGKLLRLEEVTLLEQTIKTIEGQTILRKQSCLKPNFRPNLSTIRNAILL